MSAQLSRCVAVYSRHFVASRINAPAIVVAVVFTLDHFVTTQRTMGWTKSLLGRSARRAVVNSIVSRRVASGSNYSEARRVSSTRTPSLRLRLLLKLMSSMKIPPDI